MKKSNLITIFILISIFSFWMGTEVEQVFTGLDEIGKPSYEKKQIYFPTKNTSIYLKSKNWGLTADHKVTIISTNSETEFFPDSISEYIFEGFDEIIYKKENNTLKIYSVIIPKIPTKFESEVNIEFIRIKNNTERKKLINQVENNYQKFE